MFNSSIQSINLRETALPSSVAFDIVVNTIRLQMKKNSANRTTYYSSVRAKILNHLMLS